MDKSKRAAVIAGNWKMNKTPSETTELTANLYYACLILTFSRLSTLQKVLTLK